MCVVALDRVFLLTMPIAYIQLLPTYGLAILGAMLAYSAGNTLAAVVYIYRWVHERAASYSNPHTVTRRRTR